MVVIHCWNHLTTLGTQSSWTAWKEKDLLSECKTLARRRSSFEHIIGTDSSQLTQRSRHFWGAMCPVHFPKQTPNSRQGNWSPLSLALLTRITQMNTSDVAISAAFLSAALSKINPNKNKCFWQWEAGLCKQGLPPLLILRCSGADLRGKDLAYAV